MEDQAVVLHLLTKRRQDLVAARTQTINRLHRLLMDLVPGGARRNLTAKRAASLLAAVTPAGAPAVTRHQLAQELVADMRGLDRRIAEVEARIKTSVAQSNTSLVQLFGVGPVLAATFLGEVGDIGRFPSKHHFAAHTGTAPLEASSGQVIRHRLSDAVYRCLLADRQRRLDLHDNGLAGARLAHSYAQPAAGSPARVGDSPTANQGGLRLPPRRGG